MAITAHQSDLDASWRLLQRLFPGNEKDLPMLVFETTQQPMPEAFTNPQHPFTQYVIGVLQENMLAFTTYVTVGELNLKPDQVDQLQVEDPRIVSLKERVKQEIGKIPTVKDLRAKRIALISLATPN